MYAKNEANKICCTESQLGNTVNKKSNLGSSGRSRYLAGKHALKEEIGFNGKTIRPIVHFILRSDKTKWNKSSAALHVLRPEDCSHLKHIKVVLISCPLP